MSGNYTQQGSVGSVYEVTDLGKGLTIKKSSAVNFNHPKATWLLELAEFPGDRNLKQNHVNHLTRVMLRGTFHPEWVQLITCKLKGETYRMNGQHTAWARLEMPKTFPCKVMLIEYEAATDHDMRQLYASIDRASPRTKANVIESYLGGSAAFKDLKKRTLRELPRGFAAWLWEKKDRRAHDGDDIAYLLQTDYYDLTMKVGELLDDLSPAENKHIFRAPVVAAMYATINKSPRIARDFWLAVADGVGFDSKDDPQLRLRTELQACALNASKISEKKRVSGEWLFRACVTCWNAHRSDKGLRMVRVFERGKRLAVK